MRGLSLEHCELRNNKPITIYLMSLRMRAGTKLRVRGRNGQITTSPITSETTGPQFNGSWQDSFLLEGSRRLKARVCALFGNTSCRWYPSAWNAERHDDIENGICTL